MIRSLRFLLRVSVTLLPIMATLGVLGEGDRYFENASINVDIKSDVKVQGDYHFITFNDYGNASSIASMMKKRLSTVKDLGIGKISGNFQATLGDLNNDTDKLIKDDFSLSGDDSGESGWDKIQNMIDSKVGKGVKNISKEGKDNPSLTSPSRSTTTTTSKPKTQSTTPKTRGSKASPSIPVANSIPSGAKSLGVATPPIKKTEGPSKSTTLRPQVTETVMNSRAEMGDGVVTSSMNVREANSKEVVVVKVSCVHEVSELIGNHLSNILGSLTSRFPVNRDHQDEKYAQLIDIAEATLLQLCVDDPAGLVGKFKIAYLYSVIGLVSAGVNYVDANVRNISTFVFDSFMDATPDILSDIMSKAASISRASINSVRNYVKVVEKKSMISPRRKREIRSPLRRFEAVEGGKNGGNPHRGVKSRNLLQVVDKDRAYEAVEGIDEDDFFGSFFDSKKVAEGLREDLVKTKERLRGLKPIVSSLREPELRAANNSTSSITDSEKVSFLSSFMDEAKGAVRVYMFSKIPNLLEIRKLNDPRYASQNKYLKSGLISIVLLKNCTSIPVKLDKTADLCSAGLIFVLMEFSKPCSYSIMCPPNKYLDSNYTCVSKPDCAGSSSISVNSLPQTYSPEPSALWMGETESPLSSVIDDAFICEISNYPVPFNDKECSSSSYIRTKKFVDLSIYMLKNGSLILGDTPKLDLVPYLGGPLGTSFSCLPETECSGCLTLSKTCSGDDMFCRSEGVICSSDSECTCTANKLLETYILTTKSTNLKPGEEREKIKLRSHYKMWLEVETAIKKPQDPTATLKACTLNTLCSYGRVDFSSSCTMKLIKIEINAMSIWVKNKATNATTMSIALPWDLVETTNYYLATVFFTDGAREQMRVEGTCKPFRVCQRITCLFCKDYVASPKCWGLITSIVILAIFPVFLFGFLLISMMILIRIGCLKDKVEMMLKWIWVFCCPCHLLYLLLLRILRKSYTKYRRTHATIKNYHDDLKTERLSRIYEDHPTIVIENRIPPAEKKNEVRGIPGEARTKYVLPKVGIRHIPPHLSMFQIAICSLCFLSILNITESCATYQTTIINSKECKSEGPLFNCEIKANLELNIPGERQTMCYIVKTEDGKVVHSLVIMVNRLTLTCVQAVKYYVFQPNVRLMSHGNCPSVDKCHEGPDVACKKYLSGDTMADDIFPRSIGKLRKKYCSSAPGCWANGCLGCSQACAFSVAVIENLEKEYYKVSKCSQWEYRFSATLIFSGSTKFVKKVTLRGSTPQENLNMKMFIKAITVPPSNIVDKCFLLKGKGASITECSGSDSLVAGYIGEVRCKSESEAIEPRSTCLFAGDSISANPSGWEWSVQDKFLNISEIFRRNSLPVHHGGYLLSYEEGEIVSELPSSTILSLGLIISGYKVSYSSVSESCFAKEINLEGCYNCEEGARLALTVDSSGMTAESGTITSVLDCPVSKMNTIIMVTKGVSELFSRIQVPVGKVNELCNYTCGTHLQEIRLIATLEEKISLVPLDHSKVLETTEDFHQDPEKWDFLKFFSLDNIKKSLYVLAGIFLFFTAIIVLYKLWMMLRFDRKPLSSD